MSKPNNSAKDMPEITWDNFPRTRFEEECLRALSSIKLNCEYLRHPMDSMRDETQNAEALEDIAVSSAHLERSLHEMIALIACLQGDMCPVWESVDLCALMRSLCAGQSQILEGLGVQLEVDCGTVEHFYVQADQDYLLQICLNLLSNALRACSQGGHVLIRLAVTPQQACTLSFIDDGCGLEKSRDNYSHFLGGSGAGLFLCREYCRLMGWKLELSAVPKGGTSAVVQIPSQAEMNQSRADVTLCEPDSPWDLTQRESYLRHHLTLELNSIPGLETLKLN